MCILFLQFIFILVCTVEGKGIANRNQDKEDAREER
jgi:hypothetical protein